MSSNNHASSDDMPLEKDFSNHDRLNGTGTGQGLNPYDVKGGQHLADDEHPDNALRRIRTAGSISISPELFEKLYLSPENRVKGDLRKTFGNPTSLALIGFLLSLTPLSCDLMGWRGAGGNGAASTGVFFFFFGCMLMILGAVGEWIVGNTFPFVVFGTFGSFWGAFGATLVPWYNAYGAYVTDPIVAATYQGNPGNAAGQMVPAFNSSFAFFQVFMGMVCLIFLICSLRTNIVFFVIFLTLVCAFGCLAGAYFNLALFYENEMNLGASATASKLVVAGGAFAFVTCLAGWWIFFAILLASVDFPLTIPVPNTHSLQSVLRLLAPRLVIVGALQILEIPQLGARVKAFHLHLSNLVHLALPPEVARKVIALNID